MMIINLLIFISFCLLFILISIKYGFLEIMAIMLAIVALIPFIASVILFITKSPDIHYQITHKETAQIEEGYQYEALISIHYKKGNVILKNIYISPNIDVSERNPIQNSWTSYSKFKLLGTLHQNDMVITYELIQDERPFFEGLGTGYLMGFEHKEKIEEVKIRLVIDSQNDPFKQSFWDIFKPDYNYRHFGIITIDFRNNNRQEGYLTRF